MFIKARYSKEMYEKSQRTGRAAKKLSPEIRGIRHAVAAIREARRAAKSGVDPLVAASRSRVWRVKHEIPAIRAAQAKAAVRATLLAAAREARKLGYIVSSSSDRTGKVSSYYLDAPTAAGRTRRIRISDHFIPHTGLRDARAEASGHGFFSGYPGPEIIIDRPRRATWLRRAIVLAAAGR